MDADVAVIGAGIAGAAAAFELARTHRVVLLERESQPGYHATGRSAAFYTETYGPRVIRALARASRPFLEDPPAGFADHALLSPRGLLMIATAGQDAARAKFLHEAQAFGADPQAVIEIAPDEARRRVPALAAAYVRHAYLEPGAMDLDVHAIHQGFLRGLRARGGTVATDAEVKSLRRDGATWRIEAGSTQLAASSIVNAAGAWADEIGALAGARRIGLAPKRRTALVFDPPTTFDTRAWPMVCCVAETFYFKPDAGRLLASPADETPSPPCDAQPEEIDIATVIDRVERATTLKVQRVVRKWAGLRSFVADKSPVVGPDPDVPGFHWLAGQGGYGIKASPALGRVVAACVRQEEMPADLAEAGVSFADLSVARL
jgi:D-arginine dehydrogenase